MIKLLLLESILLIFVSILRGEIVTEINYQGKTMYVDVKNVSNRDSAKFEIWFLSSKNASSLDDFRLLSIRLSKARFHDYIEAACRTKSTIDDGKTIVGCAAIVGSAFCAVSTIADPAVAIVCTTTWKYTLEAGAADCLSGTVDAMGQYFNQPAVSEVIQNVIGMYEPRLGEAIGRAIDYLCKDIKRNLN